MTSPNRVNSLLVILLMSFGVFAQDDLSKTEAEHSDLINKACDLKIKIDLHDFDYGRDEASVFSNLHFEDASLLAGRIEDACKKNPANRKKLERIGTIFIKRGSIEQRKLIKRKDGDLVYLANRVTAEQGKSRDDLIEADLVRVLGLTYAKAADIAEKVKADKAVVEEKKAEDLEAKKSAERDKKIAALTAWFQGEVTKAQSLPPGQMGPAMEKLAKTYEEKLNALTNTP